MAHNLIVTGKGTKIAATSPSRTLSFRKSCSHTAIGICSTSKHSVTSNFRIARFDAGVVRKIDTKEDLELDRWLQNVSKFVAPRDTVKSHVERAITCNRVFCVTVGAFPTLRRVLQERGWVEFPPNVVVKKTVSELLQHNIQGPFRHPSKSSLRNPSYNPYNSAHPERDAHWVRRVFKDVRPSFVWNYGLVNWAQVNDGQLINRQPKPAFSFTTKIGIASCVADTHWFTQPGFCNTQFPRCYRLGVEEEKAAFIGDFCLTACIGLMQWVTTTYDNLNREGIFSADGTVSIQCIKFAISKIKSYIRKRRNLDLDNLDEPSNYYNDDWTEFLQQYLQLVTNKSKVLTDDYPDQEEFVKHIYEKCKKNLERIIPYWSQMSIDGIHNLWICKPGARSCGYGITVHNHLENILKLVDTANSQQAGSNKSVSSIQSHGSQQSAQNNNWVVQKYIETPLLVYNTKFDIRQWILVEDWSPLTVWFYKECYLRFCKEPFSTERLHESVHLCNFSIQKNYQISERRDSHLPEENVWDSATFQDYLGTLGKKDCWDTIIYPGMKQAILGILLTSHDQLYNTRRNSFELYGADFMLSEKLEPWLLEVNSRPLMSNANETYRRMSANVVEDCVKVMFDKRKNPRANTGRFELIYKQNAEHLYPKTSGIPDITLRGKKLREDLTTTTKSNVSLKKMSSNTTRHPLSSRRFSLMPLRSGNLILDAVERLSLKEAKKRHRETVLESEADTSSSFYRQRSTSKMERGTSGSQSKHGRLKNGAYSDSEASIIN